MRAGTNITKLVFAHHIRALSMLLYLWKSGFGEAIKEYNSSNRGEGRDGLCDTSRRRIRRPFSLSIQREKRPPF